MATATPPADHFICDGTLFSATLYPDLARILGSNRLPDMRDRFVRGYRPGGIRGGMLRRTAGRLVGLARQFRTNQRATTTTTSRFGWTGNSRRRTVDDIEYRRTSRRSYSGDPSTDRCRCTHHNITAGGDSETAPDHIIMAFIIQAR